jgi:hypothetical protein
MSVQKRVVYDVICTFVTVTTEEITSLHPTRSLALQPQVQMTHLSQPPSLQLENLFILPRLNLRRHQVFIRQYRHMFP